MKKILFLLTVFICIPFSYSQQTWQKATKLADSISIFSYDKAFDYRKKAVELAENESKDIKKLMQYLLQFSETELKFKNPQNYPTAYEELKKIESDLEKLNVDSQWYLQVYINLVTHSYNHVLNMNDGEMYVTKLLTNLNKAKEKDTIELISAYHYESIISRNLGKLPKAINAIKKAVNYCDNYSKKDIDELGTLYFDYAEIYRDAHLNIPNKHYEFLTKAENAFKSLEKPDLMYLSAVYIRLTNLEKQLGNYDNAIGYLKLNRALIKGDKNLQQSYQRGNVGVMKELQYYQYFIGIYRDLENETEMLSALNEMIKLDNENELSEYGNYFLSIGYRSVGEYYTKKNPKKSLEYLKKGLKLNFKYPFLNAELDFNIIIAKAQINNNNLDEAISELKKITQNKTAATKIKAKAYHLFSKAFIKKNNIDSAFYYIDKCINQIAKNESELSLKTMQFNEYQPGNSVIEASLLVNMAEDLLIHKKKYDSEIKKLYWISLKHFTALYKDKLLNNKLNLLYQRILKGVLANCVDFNSISKEKLNVVLSSIENVESRYLSNNLLQNRALATNNEFKEAIEKEQEIRANLTYLTKKFNTKKDDKIKQLIFEEEIKLKNITENTTVSLLNPSFNFKNYKTPKNSKTIRFKKAGKYYYRISIDENGVAFKKIETDDLEDKVTAFNKAIKDINTSTTTIKKLGNDLFNLLLEEKDLSAKNAYIIPDEILHYLPFELLSFKDKYLIEYTTTSYSNGLAFLQQEKNITNTKRSVALFAPSYQKYNVSEVQLAVRGEPYNLIGAREEIKSISSIVNKSEIYDGNKATKLAFKNLNKDISIIHLSMHSFLNDEIPELNSLVFTDNTDDYELYISELYGLKLNADLAVLSACNTGVGKRKDGKAIVSMNNAFTYAGVPSTVSSLWSAPDQSTKEIMIDFYKNLNQKQSISLSLRNAKLNYLKNTEDAQFKHPYYWAGFVLYGNDAVIPLNNEVNYLKWFGLIGLGILLIFFLKKRKSTLNS